MAETPTPSYASNGTLGRVCTHENPTGEDPNAKRLAEAQRRWADHASGRNPLPPQQSLALRSEINELSQKVNPGQQNLWGPYSPAEEQYLADQRRNANTMGIWFLGPVAGAPAAITRMLGGSEDAVENAGELGMNLLGARVGRGRPTTRTPQRTGMRPPPRGTHVDARNFRNADGTWRYPERDGFQGDPKERMTRVGERFDRFGGEGGRFTSPEGTPFESRALPPTSYDQPYNVYEVVRPYPIQEGSIAPWFNQPGGGIQQVQPMSMGELVERGYLRRVTPWGN